MITMTVAPRTIAFSPQPNRYVTESVTAEQLDELISRILADTSLFGVYAATSLHSEWYTDCTCEKHPDGHTGVPTTLIMWYDAESFSDHHTEVTYCPVAAS